MQRVYILWSKVILLVERHIVIILLVIPNFTQPLPRPVPIVFDLFVDDDEALIIGAKKGYKLELKNLGMDYLQAMKISLQIQVFTI